MADTLARLLQGKGLVALIAAYCLLALWLFQGTVASMVHTWSVTETFAHGFLIAPVSLWLAWRDRDYFSSDQARPQPLVLLLTLGAGAAWLVASLIEVKVIQQLAFVAVLVTGIWSLLGSRLAWKVAFPLGFLFLAVPMGAGLIPPLIELTTDTTELLIQMSGIPVYREGNYLTLPTGLWSVVEACSGIRYLIASITLGLVYAKLTYQSPGRRLLFVLASILVPIAANSLRAYGIVMIGHFSNMELATGVDHLIYGWVFFGMVMLLLFWIGSFWQEPEPDAPAAGDAVVMPASIATGRTVSALALTLLVTATGPMLAARASYDTPAFAAITEPAPAPDWNQVADPGWGWVPDQPGGDRRLQLYFADAAGEVSGLLLQQYLQQTPGAELVQAARPWRADADDWRALRESSLATESRAGKVVEVVLARNNERLLAWAWYRVDGVYTASPYEAKLREAAQRLLQGSYSGTRLFAVTVLGDEVDEARARLAGFVDAQLPQVEQSLDAGITRMGGEP